MKVGAVIAEYNPFHNGHAYHIAEMRKQGCTHILAVMSGDFVQRGAPAIAPMHLRAQAAVEGGADLVLLLPLPWSISAAPDFAFGGASLIKATKSVDTVSFGCETEDGKAFACYNEQLQEQDLQNRIAIEIATGVSYPQAVANACKKQGRDALHHFLSTPNNVLGLEYCRHLQGSNIQIMPIRRKAAAHDDENAYETIASASYIRKQFYRKYNSDSEVYDLYKFIPESSEAIWTHAADKGLFPVSEDAFSRASLSRLRLLSEKDLCLAPYVSDGLEYRLLQAIRKSTSFDEACSLAKSKNISLARIRRTFLCAALGFTEAHIRTNTPYFHILASNRRGHEILRLIKENSAVPIISKHADSEHLDNTAKELYDLNMAASDFYSICLPKPLACGRLATTKIYNSDTL